MATIAPLPQGMQQQSKPTNPGFQDQNSSGREVFDNKKATHREVASFVQTNLQRHIGPLAQKQDQFMMVLDSLFLYLAEVGICGVKITQEEIAGHYKKRLEEEKAKQQERYEAARKAAEEKAASGAVEKVAESK